MKPLYDITPFTLLDYPTLPAAILWFAGCNLRCSYCYNPEIVLGEGRFDEKEALEFLYKRHGLLEGVVLSGGECTLYQHILSFTGSVKELGYKIKLDTNGMRPDVITSLAEAGLIDYVALDYKAPASKMADICGGGSEKRFWESFNILQEHGIEYEVRTTFHSALLSETEINAMAESLQSRGYNRPFFVQQFQLGANILGVLPDSTKMIDIGLLGQNIVVRN